VQVESNTPDNRVPEQCIDKDVFKQIFLDNWDTFLVAEPRYNNDYHRGVVQKMLDCGDAKKMGYAQYRCCCCGEVRRVAFSCKSCFCLSCGKAYAERWTEVVGNHLLPGVVYRHIVLTVPECLRLWFYRNPALLSSLMRCGNECLKDTLSTAKKTDLDIGTVIVLHTAGRPAQYNPHLHILVTAGGISAQGKWVGFKYLPYKLLRKKWQYHLLSMLRREAEGSDIERAIDHCWETYTNGFVTNIQPGEVPPGGKGLARYLAKYLVSPPISIHRIEKYDGETVSYWYRDHRTHSIEHVTLPVLRFIGRMVQHILPKGFQRIRYYGLHSHVRYADMRTKVATIVPSDDPTAAGSYRVIARKSFQQLFLETFGFNPLLCVACGEQMELERIWHPKYGTVRNFFEEEMQETLHVRRRPGSAPRADVDRRPLDGTQRMVPLPLPDV